MSNIFGAGLALTAMAQSSTYKRAYKKFGTKKTKGMLHAMQRHATAINPSNRNMFKEALSYSPSNQRSTPKQNIGQASGLAIRQEAPRHSRTQTKPRSRVGAQARSKRRSFSK